MTSSEAQLKHLVRNYSESLAQATVAFPINNKLILTRQKLVFEKNSWFNHRLFTMNPISISNVTASIGPMFGIIYLSHGDREFPKQVGLFWRKDIILMKRIIEGYILALRQGINIEEVEYNELVELLTKLGTDDPTIR